MSDKDSDNPKTPDEPGPGSPSNDPLADALQEEIIERVKEGEIEELTQEDIQNIMGEAINDLATHTYEQILNEDDGLERFHQTREDFEENLQERWGEPLELLERFILWSMESGRALNRNYRFEAAQNQDYLFEALVHLHARAIQVAMEIHHLLSGGFADGAFARWRSLYEISITASFIAEHGDETAERFLSYRYIWEYYFAEIYEQHQDDLDVEPLDTETIEKLDDAREELVDRFDESIDDGGYGSGWAAKAYSGNGGPSIHDMKEEAGLELYSPYYKLACESVHAGSKGTLDRLGIIEHEDIEQPDLLLAGPSNAGLSLPGQLTAIALAQITFALLMLKPISPNVADMQGMQMLVDDIENSFADVSEKLEQDDREATEEWANQDIVDITLNYVDQSKLFSEEFFDEYTDFDSVDEFEEALPVALEDVKQGNSVSSEVDEVVRGHSEFGSFQDLVDTALERWVRRDVDLSQFDIDKGE